MSAADGEADRIEANLPLRAQVVVIGSGAGGATTAKTLAETGYDVAWLEEGPNVDTSAIDTNSIAAIERLYRNGGMTPVLGNQSIAFVEGRCVGGSTEVNSGFWHRLPADCYHRWRADALLDDFSPERLEPYFERAERDLSVSTLSRDLEPSSSAVFRRGAEQLKWGYVEVPRCQKDPAASAFRAGAKQSMLRTYVPAAVAAGARLYPGVKVTRVLHADGRVQGVEVSDGEGGGVRTIRADAVFVCCGAVQTPALLRRSGLKRNVGDNLSIHPMIKAAALFDDAIDAHDSPLPMYQVDEFWPTITIGGAVFSPGFLAMVLSDNWQENREAMRHWRRMALYYVGTRGMSRGTIRSLPGDLGVVIRYRLTEADRRNLSVGLAHLGELLFAAGAKAVFPSVRGMPVLRSVEQCRALARNYIPISAMSLSTVHAFSSCPMGENADVCATDSYGRVMGFNNLYVNDASLIPDSPGVNPQGTTMAIAMRNVERFVEGARRAAARHVVHARPEILITGAPGWLGTRLVELLANGLVNGAWGPGSRLVGKPIRCLVHPSADPAALERAAPNVELCPGDVTDAGSVRAFLRGAEGATLIHIAGLIHPRRWTRDFERINVGGTRHVLDAAVAARVKRIVAVSSNSPFGFNPSPTDVFTEDSSYSPYRGYGRSKREMERLVNEAQAGGRIEAVIIRPPWFYGPHQPPRQTLFFRMIKQGTFPVLGSGEQRRSMAYVDNICQGLALAATVDEADGRTYWIADERPYSINEIVATVEEVLEQELGIRPPERRRLLPGVVGDFASFVDGCLQGVGLYEQRIHVLGEMNETIACSIERARRDLGYEPQVSLRDGMRASVRWCIENGQQI
jgi:nucleoside-diphosphate-sugar epimerase/choline dehydrogenase-like flavoprotein